MTKDDMVELLGELLGFIKSDELGLKVAETWLDACERGGWKSVEEVRALPFTLLTNCRDIGFVEHTIAVTKGAYGLAMGQEEAYETMPYPVDYDRLIAGGLLHDVGKLVEFEKDGKGGYQMSHNGKCTGYPISGAIIAAQHGVPDEILNIIACHGDEGDGCPQVIENVFLHQADLAASNPMVMMEKGTLILE